MRPYEVHEILKSIVHELGIPVGVGSGNTLLIVEGEEREAKQCKENILERWQGEDTLDNYLNKNQIDGHWRITHRSTLSEINKKIEKLAIGTTRVLEVKEVLQALITERELPFRIYYAQINVAILPEKPSDYQTDEMIELNTLIQEMQQDGRFEDKKIDVYVRHSGFELYQEEDFLDVDFALVKSATQRLQSEIDKYGLQVRLLHNGFVIVKDREIEIHVSEAEELAYRLMVMTGINYRVLSYGMGENKDVKPGWKTEINWLNASLCNDRAYPYI